VFGLIVADLIAEPVNLRQLPAGSLARLRSLSLHPGGNACNVAMALARLGGDLGVEARTVGLIGDDAIGELLRRRLREGGVDVTGIRTLPSVPTAATVVAVQPGGEPYFLHAPGALDHVDGEFFRESFPYFVSCDWLHIGYFGLLPRELFVALPPLLGELRKAAPGLKISLDTAHAPGDRDLMDEILPYLDVFVPSRAEALSLAGQTEPEAAVESFRRRMPRGIIGVKLDREGCYLDDGTAAVRCPAFAVEVVDATGAGDAWYAGLMLALSRGMDLEAAGRFANRAAADCCTAIGAAAGIGDFASTLKRCVGPDSGGR
jgi:sugar/nucleoside kinase (ribokinase family)